MTDLIYSRKANNSFLDWNEIAMKAPAALSNGHKDSLSDIYGEVDTKDVIEIMADYGYHVTQAAQKKPRKSYDVPFAEHLLAFSQYDSYFVGADDQVRPELVMYNSRNGKSSLKLFTGVFRFICSNGSVVGDGTQHVIRHTTGNVAEVETAIRAAAQDLPTVLNKVHSLKNIELDQDRIMDLARSAAALRWDYRKDVATDERGSFATDHTAMSLAHGVRRFEDVGNNLWTVYSRMQEHLVRGGVEVFSRTDKQPHGRYRTSGAVRSVSESVRVNRQLWDLVENVAVEESMMIAV